MGFDEHTVTLNFNPPHNESFFRLTCSPGPCNPADLNTMKKLSIFASQGGTTSKGGGVYVLESTIQKGCAQAASTSSYWHAFQSGFGAAAHGILVVLGVASAIAIILGGIFLVGCLVMGAVQTMRGKVSDGKGGWRNKDDAPETEGGEGGEEMGQLDGGRGERSTENERRASEESQASTKWSEGESAALISKNETSQMEEGRS